MSRSGFSPASAAGSGPHVHYEVRVNDEPQDPEKFIGLARVIPAAEA
jgi:murein DD-endopeptidase MepM/ murein hydrolase activator NlpD